MKNYLCLKCGIHIKNASNPNTSGCPKGNGSHNWTNMGDVGDTNYQCKKCGLLLQSKSTPSTSGCPEGNGQHNWIKI
jgi:DNA-directed RNA polymerase subunit RPC12/RpoP